MNTRIYKPNDLKNHDVKTDIKDVLLNGKNIIFPTETVYGIGAHVLNETGVKNIYHIKGRPSDNPLIMHMAKISDIGHYVYIDQPYVEALMNTFWPGPLTLVLRKKDVVPTWITGGLQTVGVRIPSHPVALDILKIAGVPICAPSANQSGRPSSTLFEHVLEDFQGKVDIMVDGGKSEVGLESTVLDVTGVHPVILRPGVITKTMIESITSPVLISEDATKQQIPKAPGMKYKHYAPKGSLTIVEGKVSDVVNHINTQIKHHHPNQKVGVIASSDVKDAFKTAYVFNIGDPNQPAEIASNVYIALRTMDQLNIDVIYSLSFKDTQYQEVIMNRLYKAANYQVITV